MRNEDVVDEYDWCWQCCAYHRNREKQCKRPRPLVSGPMAATGSLEPSTGRATQKEKPHAK
jgi:hypothetical protein